MTAKLIHETPSEYWRNEREIFHQWCGTCQRSTIHKLGQIHSDAHGTRKIYVCQEHVEDLWYTLTKPLGIFHHGNRGRE